MLAVLCGTSQESWDHPNTIDIVKFGDMLAHPSSPYYLSKISKLQNSNRLMFTSDWGCRAS
jgi:hypothetical protein